MTTLLQDLRYSFRLLAKSPGFALAAVAVLALGIGLNTAMFSITHALVFSPRAYPEPERIVQLYSQDRTDRGAFRAFSYAAYREINQRPDLFAGVLAHTMTMVGIGDGQDNRRTFCGLVSSNYFATLGVPLLRGRTFSAEEEKPGANLPVVIASHLHWRKTGFNPDLIGSTIRINERAFTVIGVTPEQFTGTMMLIGPELYFPLGVFDTLRNDFEGQAQRTLEKPDAYNLFLVARLAPGVSREAATAALAGVAEGLEQQNPVAQKDQTIVLGDLPRLSTSTAPNSEGSLRTLGLVLLSLTGAVLLIVCFNLAGLLLARGHARRKEFAIRLALGGGRRRIIRQLLTESLVLSLAGGIVGFVLAHWSSSLLITALGAKVPVAIFFNGAAHHTVAIATLGFCLLATLGFALGPALKLSRRDLLTDLKGQAGEDVASTRRRWLPRHPLVVLQIALSLALLIASGLFVRLARNSLAFDPGYSADDTIVAEVDASLAGFDENKTRDLYRSVEASLRGLPGIQSASIGALVPQGMINIHRGVRRAGLNVDAKAKPATAAEGRAFNARWNAVGADYFTTLGIPLLRGRTFARAETDAPGAPRVVVIDEVLAKKLWPDGDALGQHIQWSQQDAARTGEKGGSLEIVGITRATRDDFGQREAGNSIYVPFAQGFMSNVHFHLRPSTPGAAAGAALVGPVRRELQSVAPGVPVFKVTTLGQHRDSSIEVWGVRLTAMLFTLFGSLAMLVAVVGLYGIKAHAVSRRTREIGIRLALGAEPGRVQALILREGAVLVLTGLSLGLGLGAAIGQLLATLFVDLPAFDFAAFGLASLALLVTALLACWFPARKATQVNPLEALRSE